MGFAVSIHRADSIYDDRPDEQYQFPRQYLRRARAALGDWIIYYEPTKVRDARGYFAMAKVADIVPDPSTSDMFLARIEPGSYLSFPVQVPLKLSEGYAELGILNERGRLSGRAQSAVRPLSGADFNRIVAMGLASNDQELPRVTEAPTDGYGSGFSDVLGQMPFEIERERSSFLVSRPVRDRAFRTIVLRAYDQRCAVTGFKFINGGGRAEVAAAHIRPVELGGPDDVRNGVALSGTVHWMFDRGLITFEDDLSIKISRHVNDTDGVQALINPTRRLIGPARDGNRPHPAFLTWHREKCFKH